MLPSVGSGCCHICPGGCLKVYPTPGQGCVELEEMQGFVVHPFPREFVNSDLCFTPMLTQSKRGEKNEKPELVRQGRVGTRWKCPNWDSLPTYCTIAELGRLGMVSTGLGSVPGGVWVSNDPNKHQGLGGWQCSNGLSVGLRHLNSFGAPENPA